MYKNIINMVTFNVAWFFCIIYGDIAAAIATAIFLGVHHKWVNPLQKDLPYILAILSVGIFSDIFISSNELLIFREKTLIPFWLVCTWVMFATTVIHGMSWLNKFHWLYKSLAGGIAAPLAYYSGIKLGAAQMGDSPILLFSALALFWGVGMPIYFYLCSLNLDFRRIARRKES